MTVTIRDIAAKAGVATSTVSRVINGSERYRISQDTTKRVWKVIEELNYRVDPIARHIIRKRWHDTKPRGGQYRLSVIYPGMSNELATPFYYDILFGIQQEILKAGLSLAGVYEQKSLEDKRAFFNATDPMEVDGLLMINTVDPRLVKLLRKRIGAAVLLNDMGNDSLDSVCFDYSNAIKLMVQHLATQGHRHIAYVGRKVDANVNYPSAQRTVGYLEAMKELKLPVPEGYVIEAAGGRKSGFDEQWQLFNKLTPRPTAVACASDRICIEMLRQFVRQGLRVPEDIALGGYEDLDVASYMIPRLSTVHAPRQELGAEGVKLLTRRIETPDAPIEHNIVKTHLVVRESTVKAV